MPDESGSAKLAVLTAAPVDTREAGPFIARRLTRDASSRARQRCSPGGRDLLTAVLAFLQTFAAWHARPRAVEGVLDTVFDLILNSAIRRPAIRHASSRCWSGFRNRNRQGGIQRRGGQDPMGMGSQATSHTLGDARDPALDVVLTRQGMLAAIRTYALAEPGSAILRCCSASTAAGVTFATACWILFFQPETIEALPLMTAP